MSTADNATEHLIPVGETPFAHDAYLGRTLKPGQDFIGTGNFIAFADAASEIRSTGKKVILNIGDSSTAGWDTRVTVENRQRNKNNEALLSAFFRYPTYSDVLRQQIGDQYIVLNAGIPGHTSIHGVRRLRDLLQRFRDQNIQIDFVSIYYGNNDCQWEFNGEDKNQLRSSRLLPLAWDRLKQKLRKPDTRHIRLRTSKSDFGRNLRDMLNTCRNFGAAPMLIRPEVPLYWEPGKRFVADQFPVDESMPGGKMVLAALARSLEAWQSAVHSEWSDKKFKELDAAREMDFVIPRIKHAYREILQKTARDLETPLVKTSVPSEQDDGEYYVDYCHPVGTANEYIAAELSKTVEAYEAGRIASTAKAAPLLFRLLDSRLVEFIAAKLGRNRDSNISEDPENKDIYTLY